MAATHLTPGATSPSHLVLPAHERHFGRQLEAAVIFLLVEKDWGFPFERNGSYFEERRRPVEAFQGRRAAVLDNKVFDIVDITGDGRRNEYLAGGRVRAE